MPSQTLIFLIFNGVGFVLSLAAITLIVHLAVRLSSTSRRSFYSLLRGFALIGFSFMWTLIFGQILSPSRILTLQSVILSVGMAFLIHSANKLFELYERAKMIPTPSKKRRKK